MNREVTVKPVAFSGSEHRVTLVGESETHWIVTNEFVTDYPLLKRLWNVVASDSHTHPFVR